MYKDNLFSILTPKSKAKSSCQALFSPQGKVAPAPELYDNSLDVRSSEYMKQLSGIKYNLMVAGHLFLNECVPKDYATRLENY